MAVALVVVDIQPDFLPGGALAVAEGDEILDGLAERMAAPHYDVVVATQDWHPPGHVSFASQHPGKSPFETIDLYGQPQTLWPDHCVQGSPGAALYEGLDWHRADIILRKGADPAVDSYSAFRNNHDAEGRRPDTGLAGFLRARGITRVELAGLARDFCVAWSAEDARQAGFETRFLWHLTRPVDASSDATLHAHLLDLGVSVEGD